MCLGPLENGRSVREMILEQRGVPVYVINDLFHVGMMDLIGTIEVVEYGERIRDKAKRGELVKRRWIGGTKLCNEMNEAMPESIGFAKVNAAARGEFMVRLMVVGNQGRGVYVGLVCENKLSNDRIFGSMAEECHIMASIEGGWDHVKAKASTLVVDRAISEDQKFIMWVMRVIR